jgi:LuxR family maltose regulon positive regulatory protein
MLESPKDLASKLELILEKIAVPAPPVSVCRTRLLALLRQSLTSCTSTIISGRAGTGKTTLSLHFAELCGRFIAWYKVDAPDSELRIFFQYLLASISAQRAGFGSGALLTLLNNPQLDATEDTEMGLLAEAFVHELERNPGPPLLVVIEDLHLVCDADWLVPFFRRLLPLLPSDVHMLITSRTMPPAPLWRMRSKQTLSVIDEDTLSFTRNEAVDLFQSYNLTREQAIVAFEHSHGRAAALAALAATIHYAETADATVEVPDSAPVN